MWVLVELSAELSAELFADRMTITLVDEGGTDWASPVSLFPHPASTIAMTKTVTSQPGEL